MHTSTPTPHSNWSSGVPCQTTSPCSSSSTSWYWSKNRRRSSFGVGWRNSGAEHPMLSEATIKVRVGEELKHTAAEGNGPVGALDNALRKALIEFYPDLSRVRLTDYKVRVVNEEAGTGAVVRVVIESADDRKRLEHRGGPRPTSWKRVGPL